MIQNHYAIIMDSVLLHYICRFCIVDPHSGSNGTDPNLVKQTSGCVKPKIMFLAESKL